MPPVRVLFVCLGNICRSPLAEGVFRDAVRRRQLEARFDIDSAGTGAWHVGEPPDPRMRATARKHGVPIDDLRARQFEQHDLTDFDHILAMDRDNLGAIQGMDPAESFAESVRLFRTHDPQDPGGDVPDPYYGGPEGFERVFQMVARTSEQLLDELVARHEIGGSPAE